MKRYIQAIGLSVFVLGGCLAVPIMLGAGNASKPDLAIHPEPADTMVFKFELNEDIFEQAKIDADQLSDIELNTALHEYVKRLRAIEQWAGFLVLYELQLRESDPQRFQSWKKQAGDSTGKMFATANMISHRISNDLNNPDQLRDVVIYNYAQCKATIEQMELFRIQHGKTAITVLFGEPADSLYLEAWE